MSAPKVVGHADVVALRERGATVLDALPAEDYEKQHIPGALNLPLGKFSLDAIAELDRTWPVVTYCFDSQCDLSARLAARLVLEGFSEVYEYAASIAEWTAYGEPIEGEDANIALCRDLARKDVATCGPEDRLADVAGRIGDQNLCVVIDDSGVVLGRLMHDDIQSRGDATAREVMHPGPSTFRPDVPVSDIADWFRRRPKAQEFLISTPDGRLFGVLDRSSVDAAVHATASASGE